MDIWEGDNDKVFLTKSAWDVFLSAFLGFLIDDIWVSAKNEGVAGDGLGSGHGDVLAVDAVSGPNTSFVSGDIWCARI